MIRVCGLNKKYKTLDFRKEFAIKHNIKKDIYTTGLDIDGHFYRENYMLFITNVGHKALIDMKAYTDVPLVMENKRPLIYEKISFIDKIFINYYISISSWGIGLHKKSTTGIDRLNDMDYIETSEHKYECKYYSIEDFREMQFETKKYIRYDKSVLTFLEKYNIMKDVSFLETLSEEITSLKGIMDKARWNLI